MRRHLSAALAALALAAASAAPAHAALPVQNMPLTAAGSKPIDVVSTGRYVFFADLNGTIGRMAPDGSVKRFASGFAEVDRIMVGPNGVLWFSGHEQGSTTIALHLGRMTQDGALLADSADMTWWIRGMTTAADGNVYAISMDSVGKFSPTGALISEWPILTWPEDIVSGPDGNLWITQDTTGLGQGNVMRVTLGGKATKFTAGVEPSCTGGTLGAECPSPQQITVGPDGALWYTAAGWLNGEWIDGAICRITTTGSAGCQKLPKGAAPTGIVTGPDAAVYAVDPRRGVLVRTQMFTGQMSDTPIDAGGAALEHDRRAGIAFAADGKLWMAGNSDAELTVASPDVAARPTTGNLLTNAAGETAVYRRADDATVAIPLAGWATSPNFTAAGFNPHSGTGMMWGGPSSYTSYARQLIDVTGQSADIDGPRLIATLSGQIGGAGGQDDAGTVTARFTAADGTILGDLQTTPVTPDDLGHVTGYAERTNKALIPIGTRYIEVEALAQRAQGFGNDAYFDDLSLTTEGLPVPSFPPAGGGGSGGNPPPPAGGGTGTGGTGGKPGTTAGGTTPVGEDGGVPPVGKVATVTPAKLSATTLAPANTGGPTTTDPKLGVAVSFTLSAAARVTIRFDRATPGKKKGKVCVAPTKAKRGARACTRYVTRGSFSVDQPAGANTLRLTGRVGGKKLPRGTYRVVITPAGGVSTTVALRIR